MWKYIMLLLTKIHMSKSRLGISQIQVKRVFSSCQLMKKVMMRPFLISTVFMKWLATLQFTYSSTVDSVDRLIFSKLALRRRISDLLKLPKTEKNINVEFIPEILLQTFISPKKRHPNKYFAIINCFPTA